MKTLAQSIADAMTDFTETGSLNRHNPCIYRYGESYEYGSAFEPHDEIVWDLQEGFGTLTPEPGDDILSLASDVAENIA